jgi:hypothetical protein
MQYKFRSQSVPSFQVTHRGRKQYINFASTGNGISMFITEDECLARKICAHRWFREGRITLETTDTGQTKKPTTLHAPQAKIPEAYAVSGHKMSALPYEKPTDNLSGTGWTPNAPTSLGVGEQRIDKDASEGEEEESRSDAATDEATPTIPAESVSSLIEAREFFSVNYGVDRSLVKTKAAVAGLCAAYHVEFVNYIV